MPFVLSAGDRDSVFASIGEAHRGGRAERVHQGTAVAPGVFPVGVGTLELFSGSQAPMLTRQRREGSWAE